MPKEIEDALQESDYGFWTWSKHIEKIDAPGMPGDVYRLQVKNRNQAKITRLNHEGNIIQIKSE